MGNRDVGEPKRRWVMKQDDIKHETLILITAAQSNYGIKENLNLQFQQKIKAATNTHQQCVHRHSTLKLMQPDLN